jgi:plasmid stabilization system protein ParE
VSWELIVGPEAEAEIAEARDWYDDRDSGLGAEFVAVVRSALVAIAENPFQYEIVWEHYRRAVLHRFPYNVIYSASDQVIRVVACIHGRRDPEVWQDRI